MTYTVTPSGTLRDYTWLKAAVARWLHRPSDAALIASIPDLIVLGEARCYRKLRIRAMETALVGTATDGVLAIPDDYVELKHARVVDGVTLQRRSAEWMHANADCSGDPRYIAREGDTFILGPSGSVDIEGIYYARLPALSDDNLTNWLTINAPDLLLFAALAEAAPFLANDARIPVWEGKYAAALEQVQAEDANEAYSGSPLSL